MPRHEQQDACSAQLLMGELLALVLGLDQRAQQVAAGTLKPLKVPTIDELKAIPQPWAPQPIPDTDVQLQQEYDNYQNFVQDPAAAPGQGMIPGVYELRQDVATGAWTIRLN